MWYPQKPACWSESSLGVRLRHPELRLVEMSGRQWKLKTARHHADDRIDLTVERDGTAEHAVVALVTVDPQDIANDRERLMRVLFLLRKNAAKDGTHAQRWEDACGEPGGVDRFRSGAAGKLIAGGNIAAKRGKGAGCARVRADLAGGDGSVGTTFQVIPQQDETVCIAEWERLQEDDFDKREDGGGSA